MIDAPLMVARTRGELAAERCARKAERLTSFNPEGAAKFIHSVLVRHGQQSGERLVNIAKEHGYRPHDDRAFGPVFKSLSRKGLIVSVGYVDRIKGNGTAGGRLWAAR